MTTPTHCRQGGFSLVELLVSMLLGLVLIAGAVSVYVASSRTYSEVEQVAALSENGRFGLQIVSDALRHTGFFGRVPAGRVGVDADIGAVTGDCAGAAAAYDVSNYLVAVRSSGAGAAVGCVTDAVPDTDVLVIKHAVPRERAYADCDPGGPVARGAFLLTNDIRGMLFDCSDGAPTITIGGDIPDGTLWQYGMTIFYVRDAAVPTLARKTLAWDSGSMQLVTEELVEGVENLHLLFGFDSDGNGEVDSYATAPDMVAGNWDDVQSLEIHLLLRAAEEDGGYTNDKTYTFPGRADFVPADNYRRMMLKTRVSLRNPKLVLRGNA